MRAAVALLGLLCVVGCARDRSAPRDEPIETEDVAVGIDSNLTPEDDQKPTPRDVVALVGMLPSDYPDDVWIYQPASIVDLPAPGARERFVVFRAREPFAAVARKLSARLHADGWSGAALVDGESVPYAKADRQIGVGLEDHRGETSIRIDY